ncbi:zinc-binding alcohol dehydrogenase family protein [Vitiosangium sp. GDMCC 1.1324]|uniref:quinone oxidoreductase family protein n=1 Tax=Vitiosangium sp. (strain GDMCC 1.1324) TaxID=2138576 RepID=UPI000D35BA21|nr:zinc-binding alcohol dehydrogenase family protein [Vitiosangium sp. GDMCC 1.1324]PTL85691.1 alcohol dehydrogenase [Vitiosangium sp. GDMCC 1.1324]
MKAAVVHTQGQPPRCEPFPEPIPGPGEILVNVRAAGLHQLVRTIARGAHLTSTGELPFVAGVDGVGRLEDGTRVYFGLPRFPYGTMTERSVVPREMCFPLPEGVDDAVVAGIMNPGLSSWMALTWRAELVPGETVLVLGATGVAGRLAVQIAKRLGAGRVIAAGRNEEALNALRALGADATLRIDQPDEDLQRALAREAGDTGIDIVLDYLWGAPTEAVISALAQKRSGHSALVRGATARRTRLVEVGEMAGGTLTLRAAVLRAADITLAGSGGGSVPIGRFVEAIPELLRRVARGELRLDVEEVPLAEVEDAWGRSPRGRRLVVVP